LKGDQKKEIRVRARGKKDNGQLKVTAAIAGAMAPTLKRVAKRLKGQSKTR